MQTEEQQEPQDSNALHEPAPTGEAEAAAGTTPPEPAPVLPTEPKPPAGWLDILAGVLFSPRSTFERLAPKPPLGLGLLVLMLVCLVTSLIQIRDVLENIARDLAAFPDITLDPGALAGPVIIFMVVLTALGVLFGIALVHLGAGLLGGTGDGRAMTALAGLAFLPTAFAAPLMLLAGAGVPGMWIPILGIYVWHTYLLYRAIRAVHGLPRWGAVAALLTPFVMGLAVLVALVIIFGAVFFGLLQQFGDMPLP